MFGPRKITSLLAGSLASAASVINRGASDSKPGAVSAGPVSLAAIVHPFDQCSAQANYSIKYQKNNQWALLPFEVTGEKAFAQSPKIKLQYNVISSGKEVTKSLSVQLDTGSTGMILGVKYLGDEGAKIWKGIQDGTVKPNGYSYYSSSNKLSIGVWVNKTVSFHNMGADGVQYRVKADSQILAVYKKVYCPGWTFDGMGYECTSPKAADLVTGNDVTVQYFGAGFGGRDPSFPPSRNYLLSIKSILDEPVGPNYVQGWIISKKGVYVGISNKNPEFPSLKGFNTIKLRNSDEVLRDYDHPTSTVSVTEGNQKEKDMRVSGIRTLVDTGISQMYLRMPVDYKWSRVSCKNPENNLTVRSLKPGSKVSVSFGCDNNPLGRYSFTVVNCTATSDDKGFAPSSPVNAFDAAPSTALNTGVNVFNGFSVLFDATNGVFGLRSYDYVGKRDGDDDEGQVEDATVPDLREIADRKRAKRGEEGQGAQREPTESRHHWPFQA